jgi:hypothetical protein
MDQNQELYRRKFDNPIGNQKKFDEIQNFLDKSKDLTAKLESLLKKDKYGQFSQVESILNDTVESAKHLHSELCKTPFKLETLDPQTLSDIRLYLEHITPLLYITPDWITVRNFQYHFNTVFDNFVKNNYYFQEDLDKIEEFLKFQKALDYSDDKKNFFLLRFLNYIITGISMAIGDLLDEETYKIENAEKKLKETIVFPFVENLKNHIEKEETHKIQ